MEYGTFHMPCPDLVACPGLGPSCQGGDEGRGYLLYLFIFAQHPAESGTQRYSEIFAMNNMISAKGIISLSLPFTIAEERDRKGLRDTGRVEPLPCSLEVTAQHPVLQESSKWLSALCPGFCVWSGYQGQEKPQCFLLNELAGFEERCPWEMSLEQSGWGKGTERGTT